MTKQTFYNTSVRIAPDVLPTAADLGIVSAEPYYTERHLIGMLNRSLTSLGFHCEEELLAAPRFPGFRVTAETLKQTRGLPRNKDGLPIDLVARRDELVLLVEGKLTGVERGIGQLLLYEDIYREHHLKAGQSLVLVLAAPDRKWHPRLPAICDGLGIVTWQLFTGRVDRGT